MDEFLVCLVGMVILVGLILLFRKPSNYDIGSGHRGE